MLYSVKTQNNSSLENWVEMMGAGASHKDWVTMINNLENVETKLKRKLSGGNAEKLLKLLK